MLRLTRAWSRVPFQGRTLASVAYSDTYDGSLRYQTPSLALTHVLCT
jgi:hypothetical protein